MTDTENTNQIDTEALIATVARLCANERNLLAVELLSNAKPKIEWITHDNWNQGFDVYEVFLEVSLNLYSKLEHEKEKLEEYVLEKLQRVAHGHTEDHYQSVTVILEVVEGKDWRHKAKEFVSKGGLNNNLENVDSLSFQAQIKPKVFQIPSKPPNENQVAVMMPFSSDFNLTYLSIKKSCTAVGLNAVRADDIWSNSTFIQDIFDIIFCSRIGP